MNEVSIKQPSEVSYEYIDPNDDSNLLEALENMNPKDRNGRIQSHDFGNIDLSEAIKINNPYKNLTRYSLLLEPEKMGFYENLIIRYQEDTVISYITRTYPDIEWLIDNNGELSQEGFTGKKQLLTLERELIAEAIFENGIGSQIGAAKVKNGRSECEGDTDGGGTGGGTGGGGTGGGGTGGGGTGGGGTGGGGSGGGGTGGGGTGGGGSGGGEACDWHQSETTGWLVIECPGMDPIYVKQRTECDGPIDMPEGDCIDDDCPEDPIGDLPPDAGDIVDIRGALLEFELSQNPFKLIEIDCNQIQNWQSLAQFTPPQEVINKLNNLDDNYTSILSGDWDIQYIQDAEGPVVNMDYFPVKINQLPKNPSTGQRFSPAGFFNYIRKNLNLFFENNSTGFEPYNAAESIKWNSSEYLGAIMRFEIEPIVLGGLLYASQDGSVICSNKASTSWIFSTIESPQDWTHPVSGNREFKLKQNTDGSFTFFVRGVDRVADSFDNFMGNIPSNQSAFQGADALWETFRANLVNFVNNPLNGGSAQLEPVSINRVDWNDIEDYLSGELPLSDLGCN